MSSKYICIHGHFYQPPRENAWLDEIEIQESALPYHDWNERITDECYGTNARARILNDDKKITDIVNNYARISFNFGPTLMSWLEFKSPKVYHAIIEADLISRKLFDGHGSAIAQVYNHIIMPLANRRDKETQIIWGIKDFKIRFGRMPVGMWLAETAVDTETLEILAENDIKFTILAPNQAFRFRKKGQTEWQNGIDSKKVYDIQLPSGKSIAVFFYEGSLSQEIAFGGLLNDGKLFAKKLAEKFDSDTTENQLLHIATDGETYGHHHRHGEMALAYCLRYLEQNELATITNYSQYLSLEPLQYEAEIIENTSWSCAHGVERWKSDCGCKTGGEDFYNQKWRIGLRNSLNWLRDQFDFQFERIVLNYHSNPWELRNKYIEVLFHKNPEKIARFLQQNIAGNLQEIEKTRIIRMLEMQKQSMYMFTSCGWFFNDISGIETIQILQYASRGIQLLERETGISVENEFVEQLSACESNNKIFGNGAEIYKNHVLPKKLSLTQVGMHYAANLLFNDHEEKITVLNYDCTPEVFYRYKAGVQVALIGRTNVKSRITLSEKHFSFVLIYLGNHHLIGNTADNLSIEEFNSLADLIKKNFNNSNISEVLDLTKQFFTNKSFSFFDLFKDQQLQMLENVLEKSTNNALNSYQRIYENNYSLLNVMQAQQLSVPFILQKNLETVITQNLYQLLQNNDNLPSITLLKEYCNETLKWSLKLDLVNLQFKATQKLKNIVGNFYNYDDKDVVIDFFSAYLKCLNSIKVNPELNDLQNLIFKLLDQTKYHNSEKEKLEKLAVEINFDSQLLVEKRSIASVNKSK